MIYRRGWVPVLHRYQLEKKLITMKVSTTMKKSPVSYAEAAWRMSVAILPIKSSITPNGWRAVTRFWQRLNRLNYGWYRTEDYLKAVECLAREAENCWKEETEEDKSNPQTRNWLNFSIRGQRLPVSEYEALFADGQWG